jgi:DNA-binding NarL/FixJ family response regulator
MRCCLQRRYSFSTSALQRWTAAARAQGVPVIAFGRHTDLARIRAAHSAGIDRFYPRGRFLDDLAAILQQALAGASA